MKPPPSCELSWLQRLGVLTKICQLKWLSDIRNLSTPEKKRWQWQESEQLQSAHGYTWFIYIYMYNYVYIYKCIYTYVTYVYDIAHIYCLDKVFFKQAGSFHFFFLLLIFPLKLPPFASLKSFRSLGADQPQRFDSVE